MSRETLQVVYDTGVLLAAERGSATVWQARQASLHEKVEPVVPAVVLAQAWRGGPQPLLSRFLSGVHVLADGEADARAAGRACALAKTSDVVDALVVVLALRLRAIVLTSDPDDLRHLAGSLDAPLTVRAI